MNFDGSDFPSGSYIYVLEADGIIEDSKRMILIKEDYDPLKRKMNQ